MTVLVITIIAIALIYDFLNGMNDAANSVATVVATRVLSPFMAVLWAAFFNFAAYFLFGLHIANTMGKGIVDPTIIEPWFIFSALIGAALWVYICTHFGLPISVSHSLIGGMVGPALFFHGPSAVVAAGIIKVSVFIILSPIIGFVLGYLLMVLTYWLLRNKKPGSVDHWFRYLQLLSSAFFSLGHGGNDAQKTMGIIAVLLFSTGYLGAEFYVPQWVVFSCYLAIGLGTLTGGWKVIKTMGVNLTDLKPVHGFSAETAGAMTLAMSSFMGIPVSTTHTISGAIMGVGITRRVSAVRWKVAQGIIGAWIMTIPMTMVVSGLLYLLIKLFV
ncbi:MAG TPA: inorganic phosphate transporter [Tenuifilaceae bacterium]|nr:inorganic phosphate transporter [Tenuifilaceae bacterium]HOZ15328.1 inorganic phosphate transporter [Tenuifilaceae bacterium]HPI45451.1 inorganic phosphate transporter [Tenuifilaceae bacterium]HPN22486.1 inorganic phosphate transporter [Tenuifilaceae bacterium]